jgi:hypothetical protein
MAVPPAAGQRHQAGNDDNGGPDEVDEVEDVVCDGFGVPASFERNAFTAYPTSSATISAISASSGRRMRGTW